MKILYGIQGTGNGHLTRARALVPYLRAQKVTIDFVISGRKPADLFDADIFNDRIQFFEGANLASKNGQLSVYKTLTQNRFLPFLKDVLNLDFNDYDLVVSDFEPITAWGAKLRNKTSLGLSHQAAFSFPVPKIKGFTASKMLTRCIAPCQFQVGFHFHHFGYPILPPLIETISAGQPTPNDYVVYMPFENKEQVIQWLTPFSNAHFTLYCDVKEQIQLNHISLQPLSHDLFHKHLQTATGVICNAGFGLLSESLHLGKKLFVKPLLGQYEQLSNALALQIMRRGTVATSLNHNLLAQWLNLDIPDNLHFNAVAEPLAKWICRGDLVNKEELLSTVWSDNRFDYSGSFTDTINLNQVFA